MALTFCLCLMGNNPVALNRVTGKMIIL